MARPSQVRNTPARELQRMAIVELMLKNPRMTQSQIAAQLGTTQTTVSRDMQRIRAAWRERHPDEVAELIGRERMHIEHIRAEAYQQWEQSKEERKRESVSEHKVERSETIEVEIIGGPRDGEIETRTKTVPVETRTRMATGVDQGLGDPRYLQVALSATQRLIELLGLAEPAKLALQTLPGTDFAVTVRNDENYLADLMAVAERSGLLQPGIVHALAEQAAADHEGVSIHD